MGLVVLIFSEGFAFTVIENSKSTTTLSLNEANVLCSNGATNLSTPESHYLQTTLAIHTCNKTAMKPNIL